MNVKLLVAGFTEWRIRNLLPNVTFLKGALRIIVARVLLGHPFLAEGPMQTHERPPQMQGYGVPHDSIIARPGIPNRTNVKCASEFVMLAKL